jgi:type II secretory pathway component PulJ
MKRFSSYYCNSMPGYTLLELLFALVLFSSLLGVIFSVYASIRKAEQFRDANVHVTQAASFAFEPLLRAFKQADAPQEVMLLLDNGSKQCTTVRGFYAAQQNGDAFSVVQPEGLNLSTTTKLVAVTAEKIVTPEQGSTYRWLKREYSLTADGAMTEARYTTQGALAAWPQPLRNCSGGSTVWEKLGETQHITPRDTIVTNLNVRLVPPVVDAATLKQAPFLTVALTLRPKKPPSNTVAPPVTLTSTIVPNFIYGAVSNETL